MFTSLTLCSSGSRRDLCRILPRKPKANRGFELMALGRDQRRSLTALKPKVDRPAGSFGDSSC